MAVVPAVVLVTGILLAVLLGADVRAEGRSGDAAHVPSFEQSFGLASLVLTGAYLLGLALLAAIRRDASFLVRHLVTAAAMLVLVVLYLAARGGFGYNGHSWNRSFADASVVLYAATLGIGPLARLWRPASPALAWRRETGIWGTIAALIHVGIFWEWSLDWDWRPFFYPGQHESVAGSLAGDAAQGLSPTVFNLANVVGVIAFAYALVLALTSNDASQRWLKTGWTWVQKRAPTMWLLVLLHTWAFAYYVEAGNLIPIGTLWLCFWGVLLLQTGAFGKTVLARRRDRIQPPTARHRAA